MFISFYDYICDKWLGWIISKTLIVSQHALHFWANWKLCKNSNILEEQQSYYQNSFWFYFLETILYIFMYCVFLKRTQPVIIFVCIRTNFILFTNSEFHPILFGTMCFSLVFLYSLLPSWWSFNSYRIFRNPFW